jgi:hypothetical protein
MSPKMWRLLVSGTLRLFLVTAVPAVGHFPLFAGLVASAIVFVVPAPRPRHEPR